VLRLDIAGVETVSTWRHFPAGHDHPNARFGPAEREEIKRRVQAGEGVRALAREKGAAPSTISEIAREREKG
jgi:hypothetical protein